MTHRMQESADAVVLAPATPASGSVIWLHGLGADGRDFVPIVPELMLPASPGVRFVFPHAPVRPVTLNMGMRMRAWYDIKMADLARIEDAVGLRESQAACEQLIAREVARGMPKKRIVLAGFSQGGAVALQAGLRHGERLAGLMILSSYLPLAASVATEASSANRDVPIFMAHGSDDAVIALDRAANSRDQLSALGYAVQWHDYEMEHSLCTEEINDVRAWLGQVLVG